MRMGKVAALLAPLLLLASTALAGSNYAPGSLDPYFTIDWKLVPGPRGENIEGFVYNKANQPTDRMRLSIEALDEQGGVVERRFAWVLGGVPPSHRTYFEVRNLPPADRYRVTVPYYTWQDRADGIFRNRF